MAAWQSAALKWICLTRAFCIALVSCRRTQFSFCTRVAGTSSTLTAPPLFSSSFSITLPCDRGAWPQRMTPPSYPPSLSSWKIVTLGFAAQRCRMETGSGCYAASAVEQSNVFKTYEAQGLRATCWLLAGYTNHQWIEFRLSMFLRKSKKRAHCGHMAGYFPYSIETG